MRGVPGTPRSLRKGQDPRWIVRNNKLLVGDVAYVRLQDGSSAVCDRNLVGELSNFSWGRDRENGYVITSIHNPSVGRTTKMYLHRYILRAQLPSGRQHVDHINRDKLDNRKANLRVATPMQNMSNMSMSARNKSGVLGVSWDSERGAWFASIRIAGKTRGLGRYRNLQDAALARRQAEEARDAQIW